MSKPSRNQRDVPNEMWLKVAKELDFKSRMALAGANKRMKDVVDSTTTSNDYTDIRVDQHMEDASKELERAYNKFVQEYNTIVSQHYNNINDLEHVLKQRGKTLKVGFWAIDPLIQQRDRKKNAIRVFMLLRSALITKQKPFIRTTFSEFIRGETLLATSPNQGQH